MERYYQPEIETASREQIKQWQDERLVKQVKHVWDNVPYYRRKMEEAGVTPDDIKSSDDLTVSYGGKDLEIIKAGRYQIALIPNIKAKNLSSDFIVTVIGDDSYHVTFCPLTYCYNVLSDQTGAYDDELKNVVKALYKYSQEADAFFPD